MSIGLGIVLFVIGAILAFALHITVSWISLVLVGYILMVAGAVVFLIGIIVLIRGRRTVATTRMSGDPDGRDTVRRDVTTTRDDEV